MIFSFAQSPFKNPHSFITLLITKLAMAFSSPPTIISSPPNQQPQLLLVQTLQNSCKSMRELKQIHSLVLKTQSLQTHLTFSKLLSFCALSPYGDIPYAKFILYNLDSPTTAMYNVVIRGLSLKSPRLDSFFLFREMLDSGIVPNCFTFPPIIRICAECRDLFEGRLLHAHVVKMGLECDVYIRNNLMRLYLSCGEMGIAQKMFDEFPERDLVSWTTLVSGYSKLGLWKEAVSVFLEMMDGDWTPDAVVMATVLSACSRLRDLQLARKLHAYFDAQKAYFDVFVENALVDTYSKCGDVETAYSLFKRIPQRNLVSWNSMIVGMVQNGEFEKAISLFREMQSAGLEPDSITLVALLNSCANLGTLESGEWVHSYINKIKVESSKIIGNALVDMYAKCGRIDRAKEVFSEMTQRDAYTYTAMIVGLAAHGQANAALDTLFEMSTARVKPTNITFIGVLSACSHAGLVDKGLTHFHDMSRVYKLTPQIEHYGCVVDMLGRAGLLDKAQEFIQSMPMEPDALIWGSLLGACKVHGNVELGEWATKKLLEIEPDEDGGYFLMSNLYANANRRGGEKYTRKLMKGKKVKKKSPGCSLIEVNGVVHEFRIRDNSHPQRREIYMVVEEIGNYLRSEGYDVLTQDVLEQPLC